MVGGGGTGGMETKKNIFETRRTHEETFVNFNATNDVTNYDYRTVPSNLAI